MSIDTIRQQLEELLDDTDTEIADLDKHLSEARAERDLVVAAIAALGGATTPGTTVPFTHRSAAAIALDNTTRQQPKPAAPTHGKVDYHEVARVYLAAQAQGEKTTQALAEHFGVTESVVKNWPTMCRKLGLLPAATTGTKTPVGPAVARGWTPADAAAAIGRAS